MKTISRYIMTLALLLTAVTGAWAQSYEAKVVEFEVPAGWEGDNSNMTAADLPGFKAVTKEEINDAWDAPAGEAKFIYAFNGDNASYVFFVDGLPNDDVTTPFQKNTVFNNSKSGVKFYYTAEPTVPSEPTEWSLTPGSSANTWTFTMPGSDVVLTPIYAPTKVTLAANDNAMGTVEVASGSKVEWTADTWKGWTQNIKEYTVDDITMTSSESARIQEYTSEDEYNHSLGFFVRKMVDDATVTFSTTGDPFSRIEFTMIDDYSDDWNPSIMPNDNWTFEGKSAVWEGEATKSLTLQSCTTFVSKITFFKGAAIPDGVTVNGDGTFTVAKTATVTLTATPAEGYKLKGWSDAPDCTDLVREITIEPGEEDMIITAIFEEMTYTATFNAANANTIEAGKATVTVGGTAATVTEGKLEGVKMGSEVKMTAKEGYKFRKVEVKKKEETPAVQARTWNFTQWSEATVNNIKADAAASKTEGWSDIEKEKDAKDGKSAGETEDKCFWYQGEVNSDGTLSANGSVIEELKGLKFNEEYASRRDLAIAVDYSSTSLGDYAGGAYLMLGGGKVQSPDKRICCFTIPNVKIGQKITVVVESHKPSTGRGISLFVNSVKDDGNKIGDSFMPTTKESYTWENWTLPDGITADGDTVDILVYNNDVCHIYSITVE